MEIEVEGIKYVSTNETFACQGCIANDDDDNKLCYSITDTVGTCHGVIWLKKDTTAPTSCLNQNPPPSTKEEKETLVGPSKGFKDDSGKVQWSYMPIDPMIEVVKVLALGDSKYPSHDGCNWKRVPNARNRYYNAAIRHLTSWFNGEKNDQESGYNHLAHAVTNCLFLLWFEIKGYPKE